WKCIPKDRPVDGIEAATSHEIAGSIRYGAGESNGVHGMNSLRRTLPHELIRGVGLVSVLTRTGPASRRPWSHRILKRAGVLAKLPATWADSPRLATMPWGAGPVSAPAPRPPAGFDGAWPQHPVVDPGFSAPVIGLDPSDRHAHQRFNVLRYLGQ